jgi:hypothetical protein
MVIGNWFIFAFVFLLKLRPMWMKRGILGSNDLL